MARYNVGLPMERIALDILGPLPLSESGKADYFIKWPEAFALPNQQATTVAKVLVQEVICRFGVPLEIHSDQGRNFESALYVDCWGLQKLKTHPYTHSLMAWLNE